MSSKILTGDAAKAAAPIKWSHRVPIGATPAQLVACPAPAQPYRPYEPGPTWDERLDHARQAGRAEAEKDLRAQMKAHLDAVNLRLARAVEELSSHKASLRRDAEQDVVKLAIAIARKVLLREIAVDSEALLGLVKVALEKLEARELHRVRVHPEQVDAIQRALQSIGAPRQIEVYGDPGLEYGAAIFETSRGSLDASIDTQLRQIERGFTDLVARR